MDNRMDIYIRLNEDPDKDYCLSVKKDLQVKDLKEIFTKVPVILSPNYFHSTVPKGFKVSAHPGHLTAEGALLFDWNADYEEYLVSVDQLAPIGEALVPGCLVVPVWEFKPLRYYGMLSILLLWWYLDWPDFLSPTPGNQPSVLLGRFLAKYSTSIRDEVMMSNAFEGLHWEILFGVIHTVKVALIWLVFRVGIINVRTLNPFKGNTGPTAADISSDLLMNLGWTSVRRMQPDDWDNKHRDHVIANHDNSIVKAYASGALKIKDSIPLEEGEGWSVLRNKDHINSVKVGADFLDENDKFVVSDRYLTAVAVHAQKELKAAAAKSTENDLSALEKVAKDVRQFGFIDGPAGVKKTFLRLENERFPKKTEKRD